MGLKIKGWHRFQHFKDRSPPWIKLYRSLLDDVDWHHLDGQSAKALIMLWLLASERGGELPDYEIIAFRLRMSENSVKTTISKLESWLIQDDITAISRGDVSDYQETETETETETEVASRDSSRSPCYPANGEIVEKIPLLGNKEWGVPKDFLSELERAYPLVDGPATLREIRAWCLSNPSKRKTLNGVRRFINRWFERTQNA